jgi:nicotinamidase-related amidase
MRSKESEWNPAITIAREESVEQNTALLVIDVQMFGFGEDSSVHPGEALLAKIGGLIVRARAAGVPVIYVQHCGAEGEIDEPGTPAWELHPAIAPAEGEPMVQKRHPDAFQGTALQAELESRNVKRLVVAGMKTEYCVDTTCRRACRLGYDVVLAEDAHSTWDAEHLTASRVIAHHNATLGGWFVKLKAARDIAFGEKI